MLVLLCVVKSALTSVYDSQARPILLSLVFFVQFVRGRLIFVESANSQNSENDIDS